jgi:hypothetical protein
VPTESIVGIVIQARDEATSGIAGEPMSATMDAIRTLIRGELRRCGLRPPTPRGPGAWRWDAARDEWIALVPPDAATAAPADRAA